MLGIPRHAAREPRREASPVRRPLSKRGAPPSRPRKGMDHMSESGSVSAWIEDLKDGDPRAAAQLWNRFHFPLLNIARRRLQGTSRRVTDEEDLVATAFASFFHRASTGQFPHLAGRAQLWALLVAITDRKAVNSLRRHLSAKRGGGKVRGDSNVDAAVPGGSAGPLARIECGDPSPEILAFVTELIDRLDDNLRQIVSLKLDGFTNEEIARRLNRSLATVERRLRLLRDEWARELLG
jgi:DNA-directed RNA polymerase specialized sigma24 family protein